MRPRILLLVWVALPMPGCFEDPPGDGAATDPTTAATDPGDASGSAGTAMADATANASADADTTAAPGASGEDSTDDDAGSSSDGTTGEPIVCVPVDERVLTSRQALVGSVSAAWAGDGLGAVWADARHGDTEVYFGRFDAAGDPLADEVRLTDAAGESALPRIARNDDGFAIAWADERNGPELMWRRVADDGAPIGDELVLGAGGGFAAVAWSGSEHAVAWSGPADGDAEIFFARVTDIADPPTRITYALGGSFLPAIAWDGAQFGLAWQDQRAAGAGIYVTRVAPDGTEIDDESWLTPEGGGGANISFSGDTFLVGWSFALPTGDRQVLARRMDSRGAPQGDELVLVPDGTTQAAVVANDAGEIGVAAAAGEIVFARFDATGAAIGELVALSDGLVVPEDSAPWPRIVAAGDGFAVTWTDHRSGEGEAFYARTCP